MDVGCANTQGRKRGGRTRRTQVPGPLRVGARPSAQRLLPRSDHVPGTGTPAGSPGTARPRAPRACRVPAGPGKGLLGAGARPSDWFLLALLQLAEQAGPMQGHAVEKEDL